MQMLKHDFLIFRSTRKTINLTDQNERTLKDEFSHFYKSNLFVHNNYTYKLV
jgi:hypothetical protein